MSALCGIHALDQVSKNTSRRRSRGMGGDWMGKDAVVKIRKPRSWRHPDLEKRLGFRRMQSEVRLLIRLHNEGISCSKNLGC